MTNDLDFGRILAVEAATSPSVLVLRLRDTHPDRLVELLASILPGIDDTLEAGSFVVIEDAAVRARKLPVS